MNTEPASAKDSTYRTMFGWCSFDRMRTSRATASANRAAASLFAFGSEKEPPSSSANISFTARAPPTSAAPKPPPPTL